jgi:hypothetical protein
MGTVNITYGDSAPKLVVGAAVQSRDAPAKMLVQIGSDNVDCDTYLDNFEDLTPPHGTFVWFQAEKTPGMTNTSVAVMKSSSNSVAINESTGTVVVTTADARVTGQVTFATTDEEVGMILVSGTYDVKRCF